MSQYIDKLQPGEKLKITGVAGDIIYKGFSQFMFRYFTCDCNDVGTQ